MLPEKVFHPYASREGVLGILWESNKFSAGVWMSRVSVCIRIQRFRKKKSGHENISKQENTK